MKVMLCILIIFEALHISAIAEVFDNLDARTKTYVIAQLSFAVGDSDIAILHARSDEWVRLDDMPLSAGQQSTFGLRHMRFIKMLKGTAHIAHNEVIYIYEPYNNNDWLILSEPTYGKPAIVPPPYWPLFLADDTMKLVFMKRQTEPIRDRLQDGCQKRDPQIKTFVEDAMKMDDAGKFMAKHNLATMFANKVYRIMEGCVFRVDYPAPEMEETERMRMNRGNIELKKAHLPKLQAINQLIYLTKKEVSEIVFIAYLQEGNKGIAQYAAASKGSLSLEPINTPVFETAIGKALFEAVGKLDAKSNKGDKVGFGHSTNNVQAKHVSKDAENNRVGGNTNGAASAHSTNGAPESGSTRRPDASDDRSHGTSNAAPEQVK